MSNHSLFVFISGPIAKGHAMTLWRLWWDACLFFGQQLHSVNVNFLLLLMSMFLSLLHTQTCGTVALTHAHTRTHTHRHTHTLTFLMKGLLFRAFPQIFWVEPAMQRWCNGKPFYVILGPIPGGLLWPCGAWDGTFTSTLDSNITQLY